MNPQYLLAKAPTFINKSNSTKRVETVFETQILANLKMIESYTRCWKDVVASEKGVDYYDVYARLREDVGFSGELKPTVYHNLKPQTLVTPRTLSNGGINDRAAFVSPDAAECYFNVPYVKFYDGSHLDTGMSNTESYFKVNIFLPVPSPILKAHVFSLDLAPVHEPLTSLEGILARRLPTASHYKQCVYTPKDAWQ